MIGIGTAPQAWGLTQAMARRAGVDLPRAVVDGWLTRPEVAALVDACESCGQTPRCSQWLEAAMAPDLPGYCANKSDIEALA